MKKIFISILLVTLISVNAVNTGSWKPGFQNKEFPKDLIFSAGDKISFDMSQYLKETYTLEDIEIKPEGLLNYKISQPFEKSSIPNSYSTDERGCSVSTLLSKTMDFVMLCGNDGSSILRVDYERTNIRALSHKRWEIRQIEALSDENISHCSNVADIEENGMVYVVCHGALAPHLKERKREDLFIIGFTSLNGELQYKNYKKISQTPSTYVGRYNKIFLNQVVGQGDNVTIFNSEREGQVRSLNAWNIVFTDGLFSSVNFISQLNVDGWPLDKLQPDQILYDVITSEAQVYFIRRKGKLVDPSSSSSGPEPVPSSETQLEQEKIGDYVFEIFRCGIPTDIKKDQQTETKRGFKCQEVSGEILRLPITTQNGSFIKFEVENENYLRPKYNSLVDLIYWNRYIFGYGSINTDADDNWMFSHGNLYKDLEEFTQLILPQNIFKIDSKIYLSGTYNEGAVHKPSTKVWVFNTSNKAMSDGYRAYSEGSGTIHIKRDYFQGDADDMIYINEDKVDLMSKKIKEHHVIFTLKDKSKSTQTAEITFKVKDNFQTTQTKTVKFNIYNNNIGPYSANLGERTFETYTENMILFPAFTKDFYGNGIDFETSGKFEPKKTPQSLQQDPVTDVKILTSYAGSRQINFTGQDKISPKTSLDKVNYAIYLSLNVYAISDDEQGLIFLRCSDNFTGDYNIKTECEYLYKIDKEKLKYVDGATQKTFTYNVVKDGIDGNTHFILRLYDSDNQRQAILFIDQYFEDSPEWKLFPVRGELQTATMKMQGEYLLFLSIKKGTDKELPVIETMKMKLGTKMPDSLSQLKAVTNVPFDYICPVRLEMFPHESEEFVMYSVCKLENDTIRRLFHFKFMTGEKDETLITQWQLIRSHDINNFQKPYYCLTDNHLHVFERETISRKTENHIYMAIKSDETNGTEFRIPMKEMVPGITKIEDYYCDWTKDSIVLTTNGNTDEARKIVTVNAEYIHLPNKRIHSIIPNTRPDYRIVSGGYGSDDEVIILTYKDGGGEFEGFYAALDGPHFFSEGYNIKSEGTYTLNIQMKPPISEETVPVQSIISNIVKPIVEGTMTIIDPEKPLPEIMDLPGNEEEGYKVDLTQNYKFEGPVLQVRYDSTEGKTESQTKNTIDNPVEKSNQFWKTLKGDYLKFETNDDYAAVVFADKGKEWIQLWKGKTSDNPTLLKQGSVDKIISMNILKYDEDYLLFAAVLNENEWETVTIFQKKPKKKEGESEDPPREWVFEQIYDPQDFLIPDASEHITFYNYKNSSKNESPTPMPGQPDLNISIFGYTNGSRSQVFNANFDINVENGAFKINPVVTRHFFDNPIRDIGISFQPRPVETTNLEKPQNIEQFFGFKSSAIVVVMLTNSRKFTVIGYAFDKNNGVSVNIGAKQEFEIEKGADRYFQHAIARIDCDEETHKSSTTSQTEKMECVILTGSSKSLILEIETLSAEEMNRRKMVTENFNYGRTLMNVPGYIPLIAVKDRETVVNLIMRDDSKPSVAETEVLNNEWLIVVYKSKVGNHPVEIITPADLNTDSNVFLIHMFHRIIHEKDGSQHDELFIATGGDIESSSLRSKKLLRRNVKQKNDIQSIKSYSFKPGYVFTIKDRNLVSPNKDSFVVKSFTGEKKKELNQYFTNKNEPFPIIPSSSSSSSEEEPSSSSSGSEEEPSSSSSGSEEEPSSSSSSSSEEEPSSGSQEEEKEQKSSNWWIWLIFAVVVLVAILVVIVLKQKNDDELVYMKQVGDDEIDDLGDESSIQDLDATNMSDDSRL